MKLKMQINHGVIRASHVQSASKDRLGRVIGGRYYIQHQVWVEAPADWTSGYVDNSQSYAKEWAAGPGDYYVASTQNQRGGEDKQANTSKNFNSLDAAVAYGEAYLARVLKDAPKKAGK